MMCVRKGSPDDQVLKMKMFEAGSNTFQNDIYSLQEVFQPLAN